MSEDHFSKLYRKITRAYGVSDREKLLYTIISSLSNGSKMCWATNQYLAVELNWEVQKVKRTLAELKNRNWIQITHNRRRKITPILDMDEIETGGTNNINSNTLLRQKYNENPESSYTSYQKCNPTNEKNAHKFNDDNGLLNNKNPEKTITNIGRLDNNKTICPNSGNKTNQTTHSEPKFPTNHIAYKLSRLIYERIKENGSFYSRIARFFETKEQGEDTLQDWAVHVDRILRLDNVSESDLRAVIEWCQTDDFWKGNILSGSKLRKQYKQLKQKMLMSRTEIDELSPDPGLTKRIIRTYGKQIHNRNFEPLPHQNQKFVDATVCVMDAARRYGIDPREMIVHLATCLDSVYTENKKPVAPGSYCSQYTWDVLMPQFLATTLCLSELGS